ncbi:hypothetical protein H5410_021697 [Solanum commersonii]|uniref:Uncharacterized protein n=1 Tax=Solanum commersonii TaxID=4109 RepID=A0A9J5ZF01_SOLCO|nr:hypothetical protein H5410_021697 [Solanum commersonii]
MVQLERVNPSPSPTHSARESEWDKADVVLNVAIRCSRKTDLIRAKNKPKNSKSGAVQNDPTALSSPAVVAPNDASNTHTCNNNHLAIPFSEISHSLSMFPRKGGHEFKNQRLSDFQLLKPSDFISDSGNQYKSHRPSYYPEKGNTYPSTTPSIRLLDAEKPLFYGWFIVSDV